MLGANSYYAIRITFWEKVTAVCPSKERKEHGGELRRILRITYAL